MNERDNESLEENIVDNEEEEQEENYGEEDQWGQEDYTQEDEGTNEENDSDDSDISNQEFWFRFYYRLPIITATFILVLSIVVGIIIDFSWLILIGFITAIFLYVGLKIALSQKILVTLYLKNIEEKMTQEKDDEQQQ